MFSILFVIQRRARPSSAPMSVSRSGGKQKLKADAGEGPILYKVFVTTADKKGAGTDAKVGNRFLHVWLSYFYY